MKKLITAAILLFSISANARLITVEFAGTVNDVGPFDYLASETITGFFQFDDTEALELLEDGWYATSLIDLQFDIGPFHFDAFTFDPNPPYDGGEERHGVFALEGDNFDGGFWAGAVMDSRQTIPDGLIPGDGLAQPNDIDIICDLLANCTWDFDLVAGSFLESVGGEINSFEISEVPLPSTLLLMLTGLTALLPFLRRKSKDYV